MRAPLVRRHSWLGCAVLVFVLRLGSRLQPATPGLGVGSCVFVCLLPLHPATPGWGVRCWCVCLGLGFVCAHSWLGRWGVRVRVPALLVPRQSWLGSVVWVCVLGLGFQLPPTTPGWGIGVCVCACVCAPLVHRHSWLGCAALVLVLGLGFRLRPATLDWGVGVCVCLCARSACTLQLLAQEGEFVCVLSARVSAAPCHSSPGCWHVCVFVCAPCLYPATPRWALWCVGSVLPCTCSRAVVRCLWCALSGFESPGGHCPVRSRCARCSGPLSRRRGSFPHPGGCLPQFYWVAARSTWRPAENRALGACCWPPPRQQRWAPRWGYPWRVPPASVLGCVRCGGLRVWTRSLTRPVSCTARFQRGTLQVHRGCFVWTPTPPLFRAEDVTPRSCGCVRVRAFLGRVGRASLPGAFWCAWCTLHAAIVYTTRTHGARCTHAWRTLHARMVHTARTHGARCTLACTVHAARTHPLRTVDAGIVHAASTHSAHCKHALCTPHARTLHAARTHCARCTQNTSKPVVEMSCLRSEKKNVATRQGRIGLLLSVPTANFFDNILCIVDYTHDCVFLVSKP